MGERERERERERENDRSQTADVHSNAQAPVYNWKTGLAFMLLGVYIDCVLLNIIFIFFSRDYYTDVSAVDLYFYAWVVSKCRVMGCIGYHVRFSLISIC